MDGASVTRTDFEEQVLDRLAVIESRLGKVENEFARWGGAVSLAKVALSLVGFAGVVWLVQQAAASAHIVR